MAVEVGFFVVPRHHEMLEERGLSSLESCLAFAEGEVVKSAVRGRETLRVSCGDEVVYVKRIRGRGWRDILNEARVLGRLHQAGLPVPEPVAFGLRERAGALVTLALPAGRTLESLLVGDELDAGELRDVWERLARLVRRLHDEGVNHRDLYAGHVLVDGDANLHLLDLGRAESHRRVPWRRVVKDLAALDLSAPTRVVDDDLRRRFLRTYLGSGASERSVGRLARAVARKSRRMRRHVERKVARGEPNVHINH